MDYKQVKEGDMSIKKIILFIAGFITGLIMSYLWGQVFDRKFDTAEVEPLTEMVNKVNSKDANSADINKTSNIEVIDQKAGNVVQVAKVAMPERGWVVVHEIKDGVIANALGASLRDAGEHSDINVYLLRNTVPEGEYAVVLYMDNGDREFKLSSDTPFMIEGDNFIMSEFKAN